MNDPTKEKTCPECHGEGFEYPYESACCGGNLLGYPTDDICPICGEPAVPAPCTFCGGTGELNETQQDEHRSHMEGILADEKYKAKMER